MCVCESVFPPPLLLHAHSTHTSQSNSSVLKFRYITYTVSLVPLKTCAHTHTHTHTHTQITRWKYIPIHIQLHIHIKRKTHTHTHTHTHTPKQTDNLSRRHTSTQWDHTGCISAPIHASIHVDEAAGGLVWDARTCVSPHVLWFISGRWHSSADARSERMAACLRDNPSQLPR